MRRNSILLCLSSLALCFSDPNSLSSCCVCDILPNIKNARSAVPCSSCLHCILHECGMKCRRRHRRVLMALRRWRQGTQNRSIVTIIQSPACKGNAHVAAGSTARRWTRCRRCGTARRTPSTRRPASTRRCATWPLRSRRTPSTAPGGGLPTTGQSPLRPASACHRAPCHCAPSGMVSTKYVEPWR